MNYEKRLLWDNGMEELYFYNIWKIFSYLGNFTKYIINPEFWQNFPSKVT